MWSGRPTNSKPYTKFMIPTADETQTALFMLSYAIVHGMHIINSLGTQIYVA